MFESPLKCSRTVFHPKDKKLTSLTLLGAFTPAASAAKTKKRKADDGTVAATTTKPVYPSLLYLATYSCPKARIQNAIQVSSHILQESRRLFFGKLHAIQKFYKESDLELTYIGEYR